MALLDMQAMSITRDEAAGNEGGRTLLSMLSVQCGASVLSVTNCNNGY